MKDKLQFSTINKILPSIQMDTLFGSLFVIATIAFSIWIRQLIDINLLVICLIGLPIMMFNIFVDFLKNKSNVALLDSLLFIPFLLYVFNVIYIQIDPWDVFLSTGVFVGARLPYQLVLFNQYIRILRFIYFTVFVVLTYYSFLQQKDSKRIDYQTRTSLHQLLPNVTQIAALNDARSYTTENSRIEILRYVQDIKKEIVNSNNEQYRVEQERATRSKRYTYDS